MKPDFNKPSHLVIGASAIIGLVLLLPKLGDGLDWLAHVVGTTKVAYAGKAQAEEVRSDFDRYLDAQEEALQLEQQRQALQAEFNDKLTQIQQQQAPNQAAPPPAGLREWDAHGQCWTCPVEDRRACFDQDLWRWCNGL